MNIHVIYIFFSFTVKVFIIIRITFKQMKYSDLQWCISFRYSKVIQLCTYIYILFFTLVFILYWNIVDLQCCFRCTAN